MNEASPPALSSTLVPRTKPSTMPRELTITHACAVGITRLFNTSISAMFPWLEERHPNFEAISSVGDIGFVLKCNNLDEGARELERIARHAVEWGNSNKVEFEISKTEAVVFNKLAQSTERQQRASVRIGERAFSINRGATKWLNFG